MSADKNDLLEDEIELIKHLRQEARDVKQCFTTYSYQALIISSAVLGSVFATMKTFPAVVFSVVPVIVFLMVVCRTGIFKYASANRIYGYELHLERIRHLGTSYLHSSIAKTLVLYRTIGWEEAQRAWRICQTAIFRKIYITPKDNSGRDFIGKMVLNILDYFRPSLYRYSIEVEELRKKFRGTNEESVPFPCRNAECRKILMTAQNEECTAYPWFLINDISSPKTAGMPENETKKDRSKKQGAEDRSIYHAGSYLKDILGVLILMQFLLLIPMVIVFFLSVFSHTPNGATYPPWWLSLCVMGVMLLAIVFRTIRIDRRRRMLENELLSIHSCSIVWQAVVLAHYSALSKTKGTFKHYTQNLYQEAMALQECAFAIHHWILSRSI